jgi:hypothetical protein
MVHSDCLKTQEQGAVHVCSQLQRTWLSQAVLRWTGLQIQHLHSWTPEADEVPLHTKLDPPRSSAMSSRNRGVPSSESDYLKRLSRALVYPSRREMNMSLARERQRLAHRPDIRCRCSQILACNHMSNPEWCNGQHLSLSCSAPTGSGFNSPFRNCLLLLPLAFAFASYHHCSTRWFGTHGVPIDFCY